MGNDLRDNHVLPQAEILERMLPILKGRGKLFQKFRKVWAKKAHGGEEIVTITSDGVETTNTAKPGDIIVKNQTEAKEEYILHPEKFYVRYEVEEDVKDGFTQCNPKGKVVAIEMTDEIIINLDLGERFLFMAPWGQPSVVKVRDYLVSPPDYHEIYRIARKEFFETYQQVTLNE